MYINNWSTKLDDFLKISDREVITHRGKVSHEAALENARREYEIYLDRAKELQTIIEVHFLEAQQELKKIEKKVKR